MTHLVCPTCHTHDEFQREEVYSVHMDLDPNGDSNDYEVRFESGALSSKPTECKTCGCEVLEIDELTARVRVLGGVQVFTTSRGRDSSELDLSLSLLTPHNTHMISDVQIWLLEALDHPEVQSWGVVADAKAACLLLRRVCGSFKKDPHPHYVAWRTEDLSKEQLLTPFLALTYIDASGQTMTALLHLVLEDMSPISSTLMRQMLRGRWEVTWSDQGWWSEQAVSRPKWGRHITQGIGGSRKEAVEDALSSLADKGVYLPAGEVGITISSCPQMTDPEKPRPEDADDDVYYYVIADARRMG